MGKYTAARDLDLTKTRHWYLVANRSGAVVYEGRLGEDFQFRLRLENPGGRLTDSALDSDRPGRSFASAPGSGIRHGLDREASHHERQAAIFAADIAKTLQAGAVEGLFSDLVVVAEPHFLGLIRKELPQLVQSRVKLEIPRDFAQGSERELQAFIQTKMRDSGIT